MINRSTVVRLVIGGLAMLLFASGASSIGAREGVAARRSAPRAFAVALAVPGAGDVSYGVTQVRIATGSQSFASPPVTGGQIVFAGHVGGLAIVARSPQWRVLHATTKVYVVVSTVAGAGAAVRDVAFFILTRRTGSKSRRAAGGEVIFSISNAQAATHSFWVRGIDRRGYANIFQVRDVLATALRNWTRYLRVLKVAHALAAAEHPLDLSARARLRAGARLSARASRRRTRGLWTGGQRPSRRIRAIFRLLVDGLGNPLEYAAARTNALVRDLISHELNNPRLAQRWRDVTGKLPLKVPDRYAAAAQEEARFTRIVSPRISQARVAINDPTNSADQFWQNLSDNATILTVDLLGCATACTPGRVTGQTLVYGKNIDCPPPDPSIHTCVASFLTGQTWETLTAVGAPGWTLFAWHGCDEIVAGKCRVLVGGANRAVSAEFHVNASTVIVEVLSHTNGSGTVTASPSGDSCHSTCVWQFSPGDHQRLTAVASHGSSFFSWGGAPNVQGCDSTSGNTCDVTIPSGNNVLVYAHFEAVGDAPPAASFTAGPNPTSPEQPVNFDASASSDPDGQITQYSWNFGDGSAVDSSASPTAVHSYFCYGTVTLTLTVTDETGQTGQARSSLTIAPARGFNPCA